MDVDSNYKYSEEEGPLSNGDTLLTVKRVSEITGISINTLNQWRSKKRNIPYIKIGGRFVRYSSNEVIKYLERCRVSVSERRRK
jgi:predicted DNA-binding transcriptional regulator AlpA